MNLATQQEENLIDSSLQKKVPIRLKGIKKRRLVEAVLKRDKKCVFCGTYSNLTPAHIVRVSQGGEDTMENIVTACLINNKGGAGCHTKFDLYEKSLPGRILDGMTVDHIHQFFTTRGGLCE